MINKPHNICTRCGTERIVSRTWEEKLDNSTIINTEKICPNPACQKIVARENKASVDRYHSLRKKSEARMISRRATIKKLRGKKK